MMFKRSLFIVALLASAAAPARADDLANRVEQLQEQIRQLTGQVEQLTYEVKQLKAQRKFSANEPLQPVPGEAPAIQGPVQAPGMPKAAGQLAAQDLNAGQGEETIIDNAAPAAPAGKQPAIAGGIQQGQPLAPAPTMLGMNNKAAQPGDGGFQGKVLVAPGGVAAADANDQQAQPAIAQPVSAQAPEANTPDDLYQRGYDALNRLDYPRAEANFKDFLASYPDHPLAGQTLFWLGESYWGEQNFAAAAKSYQDSYKQFPKSRRAPDAFLKLGLSLARLGQKDQACIIIGSVDSEYPSAIDVKKKAQAAFKREGCS